MSEYDTKRIKIIPHMVMADDWSEIERTDVSYEAFSARMTSLESILRDRGGFDRLFILMALTGIGPKLEIEEEDSRVLKATEEVAVWARQEYKTLRELEELSRQEREGRVQTERSESPVLHGNAISRVVLADLAITLLGTVQEPGQNLVMLLVELLGVDKHRLKNAEHTRPSMAIAAQVVAQHPSVSNADLARFTGRDKATISRWRRDPEFEQEVEKFKMVFFDNPIIAHFEKFRKQQTQDN